MFFNKKFKAKPNIGAAKNKAKIQSKSEPMDEPVSVIRPFVEPEEERIESPKEIRPPSPVKKSPKGVSPVTSPPRHHSPSPKRPKLFELPVRASVVRPISPRKAALFESHNVDLDQSLRSDSSLSRPMTPSCASVHSEAPKVSIFKEKKREFVARPRYRPDIKPDEPLDKKTVTMRDLCLMNPTRRPPPKYRQDREDALKAKNNPDRAETPDEEESGEEEEEEEPPVRKGPMPQCMLDEDGNIVIDETSLIIRSQGPRIQEATIVEQAGELTATYHSYRKNLRTRSRRWREEEVRQFYKALSTIGTDFSSMAKLFKDRDRMDLKKKFKREEKKNPHLVDGALKSRRTYDLTMFDLSSSEDELAEDNENPVRRPPAKRRRVPRKDGPLQRRSRKKTVYQSSDEDRKTKNHRKKQDRFKHKDELSAIAKEVVDNYVENNANVAVSTSRPKKLEVVDLINHTRTLITKCEEDLRPPPPSRLSIDDSPQLSIQTL